MPQYAASRTLAASVEDVWALLADPDRFAEWWPGVVRVEPTVRRPLAPGALWQVEGSKRPSLRSLPQAAGSLLVLEVVPLRRFTFRLQADGIEAELELEPAEEDATRASLTVEGSWLTGVRRPLPSQVLSRLAALVRASAR